MSVPPPPAQSLPVASPERFQQLSPPRKRLVRLMQQVNFGRLENLAICDREPDFDPPPRVVEEIKFAGENGPRPENQFADFILKPHICDLLAHFDRLQHATIEVLVVKHGLPFSMQVESLA